MSATMNWIMQKELDDLERCDKSNVKTPFGNFKKEEITTKTIFGDIKYTKVIM